MPAHWEKQHIKLGKHDRRLCGLTEDDKQQIKALHKENMPIRAIAREYADKCSRRTITFILFPERLARMQKMHKEAKHWKKYYNRKDLTEAMRNWRKYKGELVNKKIIK